MDLLEEKCMQDLHHHQLLQVQILRTKLLLMLGQRLEVPLLFHAPAPAAVEKAYELETGRFYEMVAGKVVAGAKGRQKVQEIQRWTN